MVLAQGEAQAGVRQLDPAAGQGLLERLRVALEHLEGLGPLRREVRAQAPAAVGRERDLDPAQVRGLQLDRQCVAPMLDGPDDLGRDER